MTIGQLRKGDKFNSLYSNYKDCLCIDHLPRNGENVWALKLIIGDDLVILYDSYDDWNKEVEFVSSNNDVSKYNDL